MSAGIAWQDGSAQAILLAIQDVMVRREARRALVRSNMDLQRFAFRVSLFQNLIGNAIKYR